MLGRALTVGVLAGLAYTLSPLTVAFAVFAAVLLWWAGCGLDAGERRWVLAALSLGMALRVAAIGALLLTTDVANQDFNAFFPDAHAAITRTWWIRNLWLGIPIGPDYLHAAYDPYGATPYWLVLAALQVIVGASPYGLNFISTAAFLAGAVLLHRVVRESYGPAVALTGLVVLLFWPTTLAWSVSMLKESMQFGLTAAALACVVHTLRARSGVASVRALVGAAAALVALDSLRTGALAIAGTGVVAGMALRALTARRASAIGLVLALPAVGALVLSRPAIQERAMTAIKVAADRQRGYQTSFGAGYKVLDDRFYADDRHSIRTLTRDEALRFLVRAAVAFLVVPAPWQIVSPAGLAFMPQQIAWYALVLLSVPGIVVGFRRDPLVTGIFAAFVVAGVVVIAPNSGNIGTLIRHRDIVVPVLVWLSAAGAVSILARRTATFRVRNGSHGVD